MTQSAMRGEVHAIKESGIDWVSEAVSDSLLTQLCEAHDSSDHCLHT